jgi:hypothetical protein
LGSIQASGEGGHARSGARATLLYKKKEQKAVDGKWSGVRRMGEKIDGSAKHSKKKREYKLENAQCLRPPSSHAAAASHARRPQHGAAYPIWPLFGA